jgi:arylsulfatase A-like enzyme
MASSKRNWPTGRGFERFYGFLGGETNEWYPDLVQDQQFIDQLYDPPKDAKEWAEGKGDYHLSKDLADRDDRRRQAGRAGEAVLHVLLPGRQPRPASATKGVGG